MEGRHIMLHLLAIGSIIGVNHEGVLGSQPTDFGDGESWGLHEILLLDLDRCYIWPIVPMADCPDCENSRC